MNNKKDNERKVISKEEFEKIKEEIKELKKYYDDNDLEMKLTKYAGVYLDKNYQPTKEYLEFEKLAEVYENGIADINDKIRKYDLSKIPFKAYKDFYNLGFDFNGSKANINFKIMQKPEELFTDGNRPTFRYKSCNLKNLKTISNQLFKANDDSFDREVIEEYFEFFKDNKDITYIDEIKKELDNKVKEENNEINENLIPEDEKKEIIQNLQTLGLNKESNIEKHNKNVEENNKESKEDNEKNVLIEDEIEI